MPRRKGYGIPPTKRIKIENDQENDENEPKDGKSENTRIDVQKSDNGNCALEQTSANASENISNSLANATTNGSNKYLHKKFKKMVALLSDDCTPPSSAIEANNNEHESNRVAAAATTAVKEPCHVTTSSAFAAAGTATTTTTAATAAENHHASINTVITTAATATTAMQSSLPKFASSRMDGRNGAATTEAGNQLNANRDYHSGGHHKSTSGNLHGNVVNSMTPAMASEEDNVTTVAAKCVCPYCELVCSKPSVLEKHLRAHTNERPYPCLPCGFSFKTRSNLLKHCRTSRSHSLKLEEAGVDANASMKTLEEENEEPEEEAQTCGVANKDESSCDETRPENAPRSIYKPKFHKAAIYIQNNNAAAMSSSKSEPSTINKLGLQLKIPSTTASATQHNSSTPSTPSPFTSGSSPSPEFLHRHISKLISENQAIVETTDPFWSKKFYQRKEGSPSSPLSTSSSSSLDSYKKIPTSVKQEPQCIEDKLPVESKLAHALLQPRVVKAATAAVPLNNGNGPADGNATLEDAQPLNLTICKDTRAKSYLDEDDDKAPPAAEYRVIANDAAARFMPNGRIAADVYVKDAHHGFVKADNAILATKSKLPIIEHMCSLCDETFDNYDKLKTHILFRCKGNKNHSLSSTRPSSNDTTPFRGTEPLSSLVAAVANVNPAKNLPNQSLGPRLGNTPLIGNYTKLSVITPLAGSGGSSSADKPKNAPSLIQAVPVPSLLTVTTNSDIRLSPVAAAYKVGAPPPSPSSLTKSKPTHVNGGVVTILHGGKVIPYVPGMPGPQSVSAVPAFMQVDGYEKKTSEAVKRKFEDNAPPNGMIKHANQRIDDISVQAAKIVHGVKIKEEASSAIYLDQEKESSCSGKFVRPSSLPLKPGTFVPKKLQPGTSSVLPLISPETPRPNKSYGQLYIGGNAYTYLGLKCSTRSTFCTLHKSQPTYVPLSPEHNKVSMYSNWKIRSDVDPYLRGVPPTKAMSCYDSRQRYSSFTVVHTKMKDAVTHSSYWFRRSKTRVDHDTNQCYDNENKDIQISPQNEIYTKNEDGSRNNKICLGGIESTDDYTYIRGQGRGKYVCLKCGIRCKKPSMLKKHIRTHTDVRPYICKHCVFRFKTKGNLTKHMKSKAHYKKCIELGIVPVPTIVDDSYVDEDVLSKQTQQIEEGQDIEETEEEDDDDEDDDDDENEDDYIEDKEAVEDPKCQLEREVARSLLSLSKMSHQTVSEQYANAGLVPLNARPNTYPYNFSANPHLSSKPHTPTLTLISEQKEQEKVSKNTGLARELQPTITPNQLIKSKNESYSNERYYFGSVVDKEIVAMETNEIQEPAKESIVRNHFVEQRCVGGMNAKIEVPDRNSDSDTKENLIITSLSDGEKAESSTSVIISIGSPNSNLSTNSPKKLKAEFISPCNGPLTKYASVLEDGRSKCAICNKIFSKQSQLRLHVNIHYFEQPFRCESCAVSFRTRNNLQKHLGSNSHLNKVSMNSAAGGQTSTNNPRPFKCDDCNIGFRIHGHLAKHLRSKMHIMKLECLGKLPFGTYAEMERCGINMNDIDTTDCENSLESLQRIAKGVVNSVMYVNNAEDENKMSTDSSC